MVPNNVVRVEFDVIVFKPVIWLQDISLFGSCCYRYLSRHMVEVMDGISRGRGFFSYHVFFVYK